MSQAEAVRFREQLLAANASLKDAEAAEDEARRQLREAAARRKEVRAELDQLIRAEFEPLPLFDKMPSLEETLAAEAEEDEQEAKKPRQCELCQFVTLDDVSEEPRCGLCLAAERLGAVAVEAEKGAAMFWLYTRLDPDGRRKYFGSAAGDELGNWAETDAPDYWPKIDEIEDAVIAQVPGVRLALKDWAVADDGSRITLYFQTVKLVEPKPRKKPKGKSAV